MNLPTIDKDVDKDVKTKNTVNIGGVEYVSGGWDEYELKRRNYKRKYNKKTSYPNRTYISSDDVIYSLENARQKRCPLRRALEKLQNAINYKTEQFYAGKVKNLLLIDEFNTNTIFNSEGLSELQTYLNSFNNVDKTNIIIPKIPNKYISTEDEKSVVKLEKQLLPYIKEFETIRTTLAAKVDKIAKQL